jgi:glycosyltransferase involved in cell wall biosynthesis
MPTNHSLRNELGVPLVMQPPHRTCEVCVILPARDESARIEKCLSALADQIDLGRVPIYPGRYEVIVLANNCCDETAALARAFGRRHPQLVLHVVDIEFSPEKSFVGCARKLLMDEACRRLLLLGRHNGIIASTDGDTCVEPTWLAGILREVDAGADAVGGRIVADPRERLLLHPFAQFIYLRQVAYGFLLAELEHLIDPDPFDHYPRHPNHNGASLAVTAATYDRIGGLPDVLEEEDNALYKAILRSGARFRHSLGVRATTSARLDGRVEHGFSAGLKQFSNLDGNSPSLLVENVSASETRLRARRVVREYRREVQLRRALTASQVKTAARLLRISASWLLREIHRTQPWGQLVERIDLRQTTEGEWERSWPKMLLEQAIAALRIRLSDLRAGPDENVARGIAPLHFRAMASRSSQ